MSMEQVAGQDWPFERICPVCGKTFCMWDTENWCYMRRRAGSRIFLCSWGCLQKYCEGRAERKQQGKLNRDRQEVIREMIAKGAGSQEIRDRLGVSIQLARYYCRLAEKGDSRE